jgi:uncharacterized protein (TIGR00290 family)
MMEKILLSWSSGKDSSLALYELMRQGIYDITLFTTITGNYDRISMHGVREALLEKQAASLGCCLEKVYLSPECTNEEYQKKMKDAMDNYRELGITKVVFGDIFLEDVRKYREQNLAKVGMEAVFPLWGRESGEIANTFINLGFKAILTCVDTKVLSGDLAGMYYDKDFIAKLPENIDPCGENGEFHTFVFDGPIFQKKIDFSIGEKTLRDERFQFCDLI